METRRIEMRASDTDDGLVSGTIVVYHDEAITREGRERFLPGSLALSSPSLNWQHFDDKVIAPSVSLIDSPERLKYEARIDPQYRSFVKDGIQSGILGGSSMEFFPLQSRMVENVNEISLARIVGLAVVQTPAYPRSSGLSYRAAEGFADGSAQFPSQLECRQATNAISGFVELGVAGIVSLARRKKVLIPKDIDLTFDPTGIFLYDGFDPSKPLASSDPASRSLTVTRTADLLTFTTMPRRLPRTTVLQEVRQKVRGGLMQGVVAGLGITDSTEYKDSDGFTVIVPQGKTTLCHFNLTSRRGAGYSGSLGGGRRRRRGF